MYGVFKPHLVLVLSSTLFLVTNNELPKAKKKFPLLGKAPSQVLQTTMYLTTTEMLLLAVLAIAKSAKPSLLKSPLAIALGEFPTTISGNFFKLPPPAFSNKVTLLLSLLASEQCAAKFQNCYGVASLQVGQIRELGLDAIPDSDSHAQIFGLPYVKDDRDRAERLADLLAERSRIVWTPSQT